MVPTVILNWRLKLTSFRSINVITCIVNQISCWQTSNYVLLEMNQEKTHAKVYKWMNFQKVSCLHWRISLKIGDSGGPLMIKRRRDPYDTYIYLAGLVSFGSWPCGITGFPTVFTVRFKVYFDWISCCKIVNWFKFNFPSFQQRVDQYTDWILSHMMTQMQSNHTVKDQSSVNSITFLNRWFKYFNANYNYSKMITHPTWPMLCFMISVYNLVV